MDDNISRFLSLLTDLRSSGSVFNPWVDVDRENDLGSHAPGIRRKHLEHYLRSRCERAQYLIIGEAVGYQGGHFSGIAMTSERILLGFQKRRGISPEHVLPDLTPHRTSRPDKMPRGFTEPTATIVWSTILGLDSDSTRFALWNAFPVHPFDPKRGVLSNRRPSAKEVEDGLDVLKELVDQVFPHRTVVAMGRVAEECLRRLGMDCSPVRHPAQGGASAFRSQLSRLLERA